jgi:aspartyl-tRNA(Asn)/glutamyl-tRNA(Gln) amidotransferase subunit A
MQELTKEEVRGLGHAVGLDMPIGLQIGGKPFAEQTVLNVAYAYKQATNWHRRRPPI